MRTDKINSVLTGAVVGTYVVHWRDGRPSTMVATDAYVGPNIYDPVDEDVREWWRVNGALR